MDRQLYQYCLGTKNRPRTERGKAVQQLISAALNSETDGDDALLKALAAVLSDSSVLEADTFQLLKPLHGCGGSESYVLEVDRAVESGFWKSLAARFPGHQGLVYIAADAALLAGDREAARRLFINGVRLDPSTCPPYAVDWQELLRGTEWHFEYRLHLLAQSRGDDQTLREMSAELASECHDEPDKLRLIDAVARGAAVPQLAGPA